jgi:hypothetical protein
VYCHDRDVSWGIGIMQGSIDCYSDLDLGSVGEVVGVWVRDDDVLGLWFG